MVWLTVGTSRGEIEQALVYLEEALDGTVVIISLLVFPWHLKLVRSSDGVTIVLVEDNLQSTVDPDFARGLLHVG